MCSNRKSWKRGTFLMALTACKSRFGFPSLLLFALLLGAAHSAQAATVMCSQFGGVVDGSNPATYAAIKNASTFGIDMDCTIKNFPLSVGGFPVTNINFHFPKQQSYYIDFLNVYYDGHMACADPTHSTFWIYWATDSYNKMRSTCQSSTAPAEAVQKKNPPSQTTATIGVPFTYTITAPLLGNLDSSESFHYIKAADDATITNVVVTDDLTTTGASLTYVTNTAFMVNAATGARTPINGGAPLKLGASGTWLASHPGVLSDSTKHLAFSYEYNPALASIPAGDNIEIDLTVVLDNSPANKAQTQFSNTANMWFSSTTKGTVMTDRLEHDRKRAKEEYDRLDNDRKRAKEECDRLDNDRKHAKEEYDRLDNDRKRAKEEYDRPDNDRKRAKEEYDRLENDCRHA